MNKGGHVQVSGQVLDRAQHPRLRCWGRGARLARRHTSALVMLFAVYAFVTAGRQTVRAFSSAKAGPVFGRLVLALVNLAAGAVALAWPLPTTVVLVLIVGAWAVVAGCVEVVSGFGAGQAAGQPAMLILAGLASIVFGAVLLARPGMSAVALALLFGLFNLVCGVWMLSQDVEWRRMGHHPHSILSRREAI